MANNGCANAYTTLNSAGYITINSFPTWYYPIPSTPEISVPDVIYKQSKIKIGNAEGYECTGCKEFYPMAELNQPDNVKEYLNFTCYSCRNGLSIINNMKEIRK